MHAPLNEESPRADGTRATSSNRGSQENDAPTIASGTREVKRRSPVRLALHLGPDGRGTLIESIGDDVRLVHVALDPKRPRHLLRTGFVVLHLGDELNRAIDSLRFHARTHNRKAKAGPVVERRRAR